MDEYLKSLPPDRRHALAAVRTVVNGNLPDGYEEAMNWGMITWQVPLGICPNTYNGQPLMYAGLASQKNYMAIYLHGIYASETARRRFEQAYRTTGKRFDVGKSCVRFRKLDDLPLTLIADTIGGMSPDELIRLADATRRRTHRPRVSSVAGQGDG